MTNDSPDPNEAPTPSAARPAATLGRIRSLAGRPLFWAFGLVCAAVGSTVTAGLVAVSGHWFNTDRLGDRLAPDEPVSLIQSSVDDLTQSRWGWTTKSALSPAAMDDLESQTGDPSALSLWIIDHDVVPLGEQVVTVTLQGNRALPVQITSLQPHLEFCQPSPTGTLYYNQPEGEADLRRLQANLDAPAPVFTATGTDSTDARGSNRAKVGAFFASHTISLARNELFTVAITVTARTRQCKWDLAATEVVDGTVHRQILGRDRHWEVAGGAPLASYRKLYINSEFTQNSASAAPPRKNYASWPVARICDFVTRHGPKAPSPVWAAPPC